MEEEEITLNIDKLVTVCVIVSYTILMLVATIIKQYFEMKGLKKEMTEKEKNSLSYYQMWQLKTYGKILPEFNHISGNDDNEEETTREDRWFEQKQLESENGKNY